MFPEKPKRKIKRNDKRQSWQRLLLILVIAIPSSLAVLHPRIGQSLFADGIALSVIICAAVYLTYQAILWSIATYLGVLDEESPTDIV
ncbi:MAG: hypothetical protein AAFV93_05535 [Chloroflexota bacterium]